MTEKYVPAELRRLVETRASGCCEYCRSQVSFSPQSFSVEHIIPYFLGGLTVADNLAFACQGCNSCKGVRIAFVDPSTGKSVALFHPRQQRWKDHFAWSEEFTVMIGLTPTGRATIEALQLNRPGVVNLRRVLYAMDEHPPFELEA